MKEFIESLEAGNFQSHKKLKMLFSNGVNIIRGSSGTGKSAIVRIFRWVLLNKPRGEFFRSYFALKSEDIYAIVKKEKHTIERFRGSGDNCYKIDNKKELEAIGTDVPDEVQQILNLNSLNIQSQHDGFFLLNSSSSGEVARKLNELVGLDIIDKSIKICSGKITKQKALIEELKDTIETTSEKIEKLAWIDKAEKDIENIKSLEDKCQKASLKLKALREIKENLSNNEKRLKKIRDFLKSEKQAESLFKELKKLEAISTRKINLSVLKEQISDNNDKLNDMRSFLKTVGRSTVELLKEIDKLKSVQEKLEQLKEWRLWLSEKEKKTIELRSFIKKKEEEYLETLKKAKICPICGKKQ